ncbi:hypothetical protein G5V57_12285 [Nordella sp. HKS 07]|nr:hypothetical protein G5V57_12285 [Nordella sp. HKS 07]
MRFWNHDVDRNMDGVIDTVQAALPPSVSPGARPGSHLPRKGEGSRAAFAGVTGRRKRERLGTGEDH